MMCLVVAGQVLNNPEFDWTHSNTLLFNENESALYLSSKTYQNYKN